MLGKVRITIDNIMEIAPKLICKNRNQAGDNIFSEDYYHLNSRPVYH